MNAYGPQTDPPNTVLRAAAREREIKERKEIKKKKKKNKGRS